jgi:hypothetical protein
MKRATKSVIALGTALSFGLAAAAVSAHPNGYAPGWGGAHMGGYGYGMGPGYGMHGWGMGYAMGPQAMFNASSGNVDDGLAALKAELGITAKQGPAWQAFTKNAKQQNENRQAWFAKMQQARSAGSAPELLAQQTEIVKQRQVEMEANAAALKSLYATLTPEQKAIADQRFGGVGPGYGAGYGRGYGGGLGGRFR